MTRLKHCPRAVAAGLLLAAAGVLHAGGIEWPGDFWTQVTNHVTAVAPTAAQKGEASRSDWSRAGVRVEIAPAAAVDARAKTAASSAVTEIATFHGAILIIR